jgi:hypothetical protein
MNKIGYFVPYQNKKAGNCEDFFEVSTYYDSVAKFLGGMRMNITRVVGGREFRIEGHWSFDAPTAYLNSSVTRVSDGHCVLLPPWSAKQGALQQYGQAFIEQEYVDSELEGQLEEYVAKGYFCPLCDGDAASEFRDGHNIRAFRCDRCTEFFISRSAMRMLNEDEKHRKGMLAQRAALCQGEANILAITTVAGEGLHIEEVPRTSYPA